MKVERNVDEYQMIQMINKLNGHFLNPDLMVGIENARSKGALTTRENSLFDTIKKFFVKETARIAFEYWPFNDLKTETSNGCKAWVVCGGKQNKIMSLSRQISTASRVMCDLCPSINKRIGLWLTTCFKKTFFNQTRKSSLSIHPDLLLA